MPFADSCLVWFVCVVKASAKRFRVTGRGKIVRRCAGKQHLLAKKNTKRKKRLSKMVFFCSSTLVQLSFSTVAYFVYKSRPVRLCELDECGMLMSIAQCALVF